MIGTPMNKQIEDIIKLFKPDFHFHKWRIVYTSPTGLFVKIKCSECGREEYEEAR